MKYLDFYYDCMESGELPGQNGLCDEFGKKRLSLFKPTEAEIDMLNLPCKSYWASDYAFSFDTSASLSLALPDKI